MTAATERRDRIRLTIPAELPYVRLSRVAIAGLATRAGFSYDEVEDLRLAVGEVCQVAVDGARGEGTLDVVFTVERGSIEVEVVTAEPFERTTGMVERLGQQILVATVGRVEHDEGGRSLRFSMEAAEDD